MNLDNLTRDQAISLVGLKAVELVESLNCDCTSRYTDGIEYDGYDEFVATVYLDGNQFSSVSAYYYQKKDDSIFLSEEIDLGSFDWIVDHYEVV